MANNVIEKIDSKIQREQAKLEAAILRKEEAQKDIAKCEKAIANLQADRKTAELAVLGNFADAKGISISELVNAIQTGNFYDLQEKAEANENQDVPETSSEPAEADETDGYKASSYEYGSNSGGVNEG